VIYVSVATHGHSPSLYFIFVRLPLCNKYSNVIMVFISIQSVIIYVVFFDACMRCIRLCTLNPGVTLRRERGIYEFSVSEFYCSSSRTRPRTSIPTTALLPFLIPIPSAFANKGACTCSQGRDTADAKRAISCCVTTYKEQDIPADCMYRTRFFFLLVKVRGEM
jgi:hypothetical protein